MYPSIGSKKIILPNRPIFTNASWGAMMFVAGMGASILWASPVEWAQTINSKPFGLDSTSNGIIEYSQAYPLFHWGFVGWALYALPGVAFTIAILKNPNIQLTFGGILVKGNNILSKILKISSAFFLVKKQNLKLFLQNLINNGIKIDFRNSIKNIFLWRYK